MIMAVYVDAPVNNYGRMKMCHMLADTAEELHAMADAIGINRKYYQKDASSPHYDICKSKRASAISLGAVSINRQQVVDLIRKKRAEGWEGF